MQLEINLKGYEMIKLYNIGVEWLEAMTAEGKLQADGDLAAMEAAMQDPEVQKQMVRKAAKKLVGGNTRVVHFTIGEGSVLDETKEGIL